LVPCLVGRGFEVVAIVRKNDQHRPGHHGIAEMAVGDISSVKDWSTLLREVDAVVHLSARVHVMNEVSTDSEKLYRAANVEVTRKLSEAAAEAGCRRFVFTSSIKVNGERSNDAPFTASDSPNPEDAYGMSKFEAERALLAVTERSNLRVTIIRTPLVYGPGVGGNFLRIVKLVSRGTWLPFGAIENQRSFISVHNLCDFICHDLATQPNSDLPAFISDGQDMSTPELIRYIAVALHVRPRLVRIPVSALRLVSATLGLGPEISRLCDSLRINPIPTMEKWNWRPPFNLVDCFDSTAKWFRNQHG
jgi:nucleoside-diphosphate-sugar epimerase